MTQLRVSLRSVFAAAPLLFLLLWSMTLPGAVRLEAGEIQFNRDIRPILADQCFACHGPDESHREAGLRLDTQEGALEHGILVPGDAEASELVRRILSDDPDERMPPPSSPKSMTARQIELLRKWVEEGAEWEEHWSFVTPLRAAAPEVSDPSWTRNPIDHFLMRRWDQLDLKPSADADKRTLIRRLSFDLLGLPPTPEQVEAFVRDDSSMAYERLVDDMLSSPQYGERMAMYWLDVVRYADTAGYHSDNHRDVWLYRDYVIHAFNENKPFDQFTIEQLAGDLLPNATREQRIASGYNRLLQTTEEGGAQPKEYTAKYLADRVRNTSVIWLGVTMGCCECHDHKFDPFTARDFYEFGAFFADVEERAVGRQNQTPVPTARQEAEVAELDQRLATRENQVFAPNSELSAAQAEWEAEMRSRVASNHSASLQEFSDIPDEIVSLFRLEPQQLDDAQRDQVFRHFRTTARELEPIRAEIETLRKERERLTTAYPTTLVTTSVTPRVVRILPRGNWLDDSGEVVSPGVPASLNSLGVTLDGTVDGHKDGTADRLTRLDLARWMVAPENPLTARVFVNRLWKLSFGEGLVRTLEDFGLQGEWPSHPELLDWLAVEFQESGWNVKHIHRLMVTSRAYRQSSQARDELSEIDPENRLLARQARYRLDAELLRDNALSVSGLLVERIGGPSVKPYQPAGYWANLNFPRREWEVDSGESLYRRGLYTYWCRSFLHPGMLAFDAPSREECVAERPRSNTPLQALVLLNDPTFVEAAKALAVRLVQEGTEGPEAKLRRAYHLTLGREPRETETEALMDLFETHRRQFIEDAQEAEELLAIGQFSVPGDINRAELAAWTSVARVILNLHETVTRN